MVLLIHPQPGKGPQDHQVCPLLEQHLDAGGGCKWKVTLTAEQNEAFTEIGAKQNLKSGTQIVQVRVSFNNLGFVQYILQVHAKAEEEKIHQKDEAVRQLEKAVEVF